MCACTQELYELMSTCSQRSRCDEEQDYGGLFAFKKVTCFVDMFYSLLALKLLSSSVIGLPARFLQPEKYMCGCLAVDQPRKTFCQFPLLRR